MMFRFLSYAVYSLVIFILLSPLLAITGLSLESSDVFGFLASHVLTDYIVNSLMLVSMVGLGTFIIGVSLAWCVVKYDFPLRRILEWMLILPLAFPAYIMAYLYTDLLDVAGPVQSLLRDITGMNAQDLYVPNIRSLGGAALVLTLSLYPYVYILSRTAFMGQAQSQIEAAGLLGARAWTQFTKIALPAARPFIFTGVALVIMEALADYGAVSYFGVRVFSTGIYDAWAGYGDIQAASKLSLILLFPIIALFMAERITRHKMGFAKNTLDSNVHVTRMSLKPLERISVLGLCLFVLLCGFVLPLTVLIGLIFDGNSSVVWLPLLKNTIVFAVCTCLIALPVALGLVLFKQKFSSRVFNIMLPITTYGYAVPGVILGLGALIVSGVVKDVTGIIISGSFLLLVSVYIIRFLSIPVQSVESGLEKMGRNMQDASQLLGRSGWSRFWHVQLPLLAPSLISAALILSVEVMKELPITLILRPFDFDTLAVQAYNYAMDERLSAAALPSLIIVLAGLVPVYVLAKVIRQHK